MFDSISYTRCRRVILVAVETSGTDYVLHEMSPMFHEPETKGYVYLAGPMTGRAHWNYPMFMKAAKSLRSYGWSVFNPAESGLGLGISKSLYLREDFGYIANYATHVAVLPEWETSEGARAEVMMALAIGLPVINAFFPDYREHINMKWFGEPPIIKTEEAVPLKVALSGRMKAGKDTTGRALRALTNVPTGSFAATLKEGCGVFGIGVSEETKDRTVLQDIGEYFTQRNPRHWVDLFASNHPRLHDSGIIITDMRNDGEFEWCKEQGIVTVRLEVSEETQLARGAEADRLTHPTETRMDARLDEFDMVFEEGHTPEEIADTILRYTGSVERLELLRNEARVLSVPRKESHDYRKR